MNYYNNTDQKDSLIFETEVYYDDNKVLEFINKGAKVNKTEVLNYLEDCYMKHFNRIEYFVDDKKN